MRLVTMGVAEPENTLDAGPEVIRFSGYYEAVMAAHQLQLGGPRAEVFGYAFGTAPWPCYGFHVVAFPPGGDPGRERHGLEPGTIGRFIDGGIRFGLVYLLLIAVAAAGVDLLKWADAPEGVRGPGPMGVVEPLVALAASLPLGLVSFRQANRTPSR